MDWVNQNKRNNWTFYYSNKRMPLERRELQRVHWKTQQREIYWYIIIFQLEKQEKGDNLGRINLQFTHKIFVVKHNIIR